MLLIVDEVNSRGGINGREIELIIEDSKSDPEEGKAVFDKIESEHHPVLYISVTSFICAALAPLAEENEVVLVGLVASAPELTEEKEWCFRYYPMAEADVASTLFILEELGIENLGILYSDEDYGRAVSELVKEEFEKTGATVKSEALEMQGVDFRDQIAKLKDMEAIYLVGYTHHFENVFKQLREANYQGHILGATSATVPSIVSMPESNGVYVSAPIIHDPDFLFAREAKEKYESKYGRPFTLFSANGYDFLRILSGLLEDEEISRENIKSLLEEGFVYSGVFGSIDVKPGEHDITFPLHPAQIVDGEIRYLY